MKTTKKKSPEWPAGTRERIEREAEEDGAAPRVTVHRSGRKPAKRKPAKPLPAIARKAKALGIDAAKLLEEAVLAESNLRAFERRTGRALDVELFTHTPYVSLKPEGWKALGLDLLPEILDIPNALECRRVRYALRWARGTALFSRREADLPPELKALLRRIRTAIAMEPKIKRPRHPRGPSFKEQQILSAWSARADLDDEEREKRAEKLVLKNWESLRSMALRYIARARAEGRRPWGSRP